MFAKISLITAPRWSSASSASSSCSSLTPAALARFISFVNFIDRSSPSPAAADDWRLLLLPLVLSGSKRSDRATEGGVCEAVEPLGDVGGMPSSVGLRALAPPLLLACAGDAASGVPAEGSTPASKQIALRSAFALPMESSKSALRRESRGSSAYESSVSPSISSSRNFDATASAFAMGWEAPHSTTPATDHSAAMVSAVRRRASGPTSTHSDQW